MTTPRTDKIAALNKYIIIKKLLVEMDTIKDRASLRNLFVDYVDKLSSEFGNIATLNTFSDFVKDDLVTATKAEISSAVLAVAYREKNMWQIEKLLNRI